MALSFKFSWAVQAVGWAVQTLAVYFIPLVQNFILAVWMSQPQTIMCEIANYIFFALAGLIFGIAVAWALPASTESGRWVWIAPVGLLVIGTAMEMRLSSFNLMSVWFGMGEAGWMKAFITWPTLACCTYSAAMEWARRRRNGSSATATPGPSGSIEGQ